LLKGNLLPFFISVKNKPILPRDATLARYLYYY